eukprot:m.82784 g.82784  ORF g.82784 m.82784 type:complete len:95 (-) comp12101_c0_seq2:67-351(-)
MHCATFQMLLMRCDNSVDKLLSTDEIQTGNTHTKSNKISDRGIQSRCEYEEVGIKDHSRLLLTPLQSNRTIPLQSNRMIPLQSKATTRGESKHG